MALVSNIATCNLKGNYQPSEKVRSGEMKRRSTRKLSAATPNRSPSESPAKFKFNFSCFNTATTSSLSPMKKNCRNKKSAAEPPTTVSPAPALSSLNKAPSTIADLKEMTASRIDSIKRHLECSHSEILKDIEASNSRLHKRFKIQNQACQKTMDEAENEFKKMNDRITETRDTMQAAYTKLITEAQANTTRVCKSTIPELSQSVEKAIDALRSHYGVASTSS